MCDKGAQVLVEEIVFVGPTEFSERFGRLRFVLGDNILPDFAVRHFLLGRDRSVGVNVVSVVDEEIRTIL